MKTLILLGSLLLLLSLIVSACGPVSIGIDLPGGGGEESSGDGSQSIPTELLYGLYALAGVAILIALMALFRK